MIDNSKARIAALEVPDGAMVLLGEYQGKGGYYECDFKQGIIYAEKDGHSLHVDIIQPMTDKKLPLFVFVQGSAWRPQPIWMAYSKMFKVASMGYVAALVEYRNTDIATFPANVEDTKTAIRFLKSNAEKFGIDKTKVAVGGDSSGGHTALMVGFTAGQYNDGLFPDESDSVDAIVDFYGITDITTLGEFNDALNHDAPDSPEALLLGGTPKEKPEEAKTASPIYNIPSGNTPPTLIVHGDSDGVVHTSQSIVLYKKMRSMGKEVFFCKVTGADHGTGIWTDKVFHTLNEFLRCYLLRPVFNGLPFQHEDDK
jgi:acetyl esterase/lipase